MATSEAELMRLWSQANLLLYFLTTCDILRSSQKSTEQSIGFQQRVFGWVFEVDIMDSEEGMEFP